MSIETLTAPASPQEDPAVIAAQLEKQWAAQQAAEAKDATTLREFMEISQPAASEAPSDMALIGSQLEDEHAAKKLFGPLEAPAFNMASTEFVPWYPESPAPRVAQVAPATEAPAPNPWFTPASERAAAPALADQGLTGTHSRLRTGGWVERDAPLEDMSATGEYPLVPDASIIPEFVTAEPAAPTERGTIYGTRRGTAEPTEASAGSEEDPMAPFVIGAGMPRTEADILHERGEPVPASVQAQSDKIKIAYATLERELKKANYVGVNNGEVTRGDMAAALLEKSSPRHSAPEREKFRHRRPYRTIGNVALSAVASVRGAVARKLEARRAENDVISNLVEPEEVEETIVSGRHRSPTGQRASRRGRPTRLEAAPAAAIPAEAQVTQHSRRGRRNRNPSGARHRG